MAFFSNGMKKAWYVLSYGMEKKSATFAINTLQKKRWTNYFRSRLSILFIKTQYKKGPLVEARGIYVG